MDPGKLRERLARVINPGTAVNAEPSPIERVPAVRSDDVAEAVGGEWRGTDRGRCLVIDRRVSPETLHGLQRVGRIADALRDSAACAALLANGSAPRVPWLFFDLETTGLSGGAGTYAFLVGCGWFDDDNTFATRQYLLTTAAEEKAMLLAFGRDLAASGALVSFNGRSFDAPLLETRCAYHRLPWIGDGHPHLDMLHPSRRLWSARLSTTDDASCSLTTLEREILGAGRTHDVAGFEVPARYFQFLRTGDVRPLDRVLDHNQRDLIALAAVTSRILTLLAEGPDAACDAGEALALGRIYARAGDDRRASCAFERAAADGCAIVQVDAWRELARRARRGRQYDEAAVWWRRVVDAPACPPRISAEATEALAIHHEHRVRDLAAARRFAMLSLRGSEQRSWIDAVRHRLARIDRKIDRGARLDLG